MLRLVIPPVVAALLHLFIDARGAGAQHPLAPAPEPFYQAHVLTPRDFVAPWSPADRQVAWNAGLPVPDVVTTTNVFARVPPAMTAPRLARPGADGWQTLYRQSFDAGFPTSQHDGACGLMTIADSPRHRWGSGADRTFAQSPGAASPLRGLIASSGAYPEDALLQFVCVLNHVGAAHNLMVQFALWMDRANDGDTFFVGLSTDGETFHGRRWRNTTLRADGQPEWSLQRLFAPFIGAEAGAADRVAVLWEFRSDALRTAAEGAWLDEILIEQSVPPVRAHSGGVSTCRTVDPGMMVAGPPGGQLVSKGINFPPYPIYTPSGLAGHVARLRQSDVHWARIEWQARLQLSDGVGRLTGPASLLTYVDLRHYDALLTLLCAPPHPIGVLGLLDYWLLPNQDWKAGGRVPPAYLDAMTATVELLARYYQERVGYWEIWNEPDFAATYLAPGDYARLLTAAHAAIKAVDDDVQVLLGGIGGVDSVAARYVEQVLQQLPTDPVPYDIFAIHPYPSKEFRRSGRLIRAPTYLLATSPTALHRFLQLMEAAGHAPRPLWITEIGWNRAADSNDPGTLRCTPVFETMVTGREQAAYLAQQFDILFQQVGWTDELPAVAKVFWYQYIDVGLAISEAECDGRRPGAGGPQRVVDWWYGLYSGTDWARDLREPQPNLAECTFRVYPDRAAVKACLAEEGVAATVQDAQPGQTSLPDQTP